MELILSCIVLVGIVAAGFLARYYEQHDWNRGRCKKCDGIWYAFDTDSQGGRGYKCDRGHYIWISWLKEKAIDLKGMSKR